MTVKRMAARFAILQAEHFDIRWNGGGSRDSHHLIFCEIAHARFRSAVRDRASACVAVSKLGFDSFSPSCATVRLSA
jgi:hypothetical protein